MLRAHLARRIQDEQQKDQRELQVDKLQQAFIAQQNPVPQLAAAHGGAAAVQIDHRRKMRLGVEADPAVIGDAAGVQVEAGGAHVVKPAVEFEDRHHQIEHVQKEQGQEDQGQDQAEAAGAQPAKEGECPRECSQSDEARGAGQPHRYRKAHDHREAYSVNESRQKEKQAAEPAAERE